MKTERTDALSQQQRIEQTPIVIVKNIAIPPRLHKRRAPNRISAAVIELKRGEGFVQASDMISVLRAAARYARIRHPGRGYVVRDMRDGTALVARVR
jgi:hypothetical protein